MMQGQREQHALTPATICSESSAVTFAMKCLWQSGTAFGVPVVPDVNKSEARASGWITGRGAAC